MTSAVSPSSPAARRTGSTSTPALTTRKKSPMSRPRERLEVGLELVAVLRAPEHHPGEAGSERRREADHAHEQRDRRDEQDGAGDLVTSQVPPPESGRPAQSGSARPASRSPTAPATAAARAQAAARRAPPARAARRHPRGCPRASSGISASIGSAATSRKSSTATQVRPPSLRVSRFSVSVCVTIAVEESASTIPAAMAAFHGRSPAPAPPPPPAAWSASTCSPPCRPAGGALPEQPRLHLEADQEQHDHDAGLGVVRARSPSRGPRGRATGPMTIPATR